MADYKDKKKIDITQGSLWKNIIIFSIPLMCSQVLEILFNMTDVAVVGRFASYEALGSVGSTTLLVTLFTGLLIGMGSGINVRAAQQLGAGDDKKTARTVHTSLLLCIIIGVILSAICVGFARTMLATVYKGNIIKNLIMDCQSYTKYRPNETTGGIFVSWRRKEELPTGA